MESRREAASPVTFDGEFLWMGSASRTTRIAAWPKLEAWSRRPGGAWKRHRPRADFRALLGLVEGPQLPLPASLDAWRSLLATVPASVRRAVAPFPSAHWELAHLVGAVPAVLDLFDAPALPFLLASARRLRPCGDEASGPAVAALVAGPRRAILAWLGFPGSQSMVRILNRIPLDALSVQGLRALRDALQADPGGSALLRHVERVTTPVLQVVTHARLRRAVRPAFVRALGALPESDAAFQVRLLADAVEMAAQVRARSPRCPVGLPASGFSTAGELRAVHDALAVEIAGLRARGRPFPSPPVAGTAEIEAVRTPAELAREGRLQRNCVASYARRVRLGRCYVYRVLEPERATLALGLRRSAWVVEELRGKANRPVAPPTAEMVSRWLHGVPRSARD